MCCLEQLKILPSTLEWIFSDSECRIHRGTKAFFTVDASEEGEGGSALLNYPASPPGPGLPVLMQKEPSACSSQWTCRGQSRWNKAISVSHQHSFRAAIIDETWIWKPSLIGIQQLAELWFLTAWCMGMSLLSPPPVPQPPPVRHLVPVVTFYVASMTSIFDLPRNNNREDKNSD